jgi:hypothetical protein
VVGHHPNAVPTRSQQGGDAFCNFCEKRVDVLGQLPAARMPLAVDVAEFAPRVALAVAVFGTVQHLPVVVVQQLLQVVAALERLAGGSDARFEVIAVVGATDLGPHWRSSRLTGRGHAGQRRPAHGFRYLATACLQGRRETASRVKAQAIHEQHAFALGGGEGLGAGDRSTGVARSIDQLLQVARRLLQPGQIDRPRRHRHSLNVRRLVNARQRRQHRIVGAPALRGVPGLQVRNRAGRQRCLGHLRQPPPGALRPWPGATRPSSAHTNSRRGRMGLLKLQHPLPGFMRRQWFKASRSCWSDFSCSSFHCGQPLSFSAGVSKMPRSGGLHWRIRFGMLG